jgi:hypothetical protein
VYFLVGFFFLLFLFFQALRSGVEFYPHILTLAGCVAPGGDFW